MGVVSFVEPNTILPWRRIADWFILANLHLSVYRGELGAKPMNENRFQPNL